MTDTYLKASGPEGQAALAAYCGFFRNVIGPVLDEASGDWFACVRTPFALPDLPPQSGIEVAPPETGVPVVGRWA